MNAVELIKKSNKIKDEIDAQVKDLKNTINDFREYLLQFYCVLCTRVEEGIDFGPDVIKNVYDNVEEGIGSDTKKIDEYNEKWQEFNLNFSKIPEEERKSITLPDKIDVDCLKQIADCLSYLSRLIKGLENSNELDDDHYLRIISKDAVATDFQKLFNDTYYKLISIIPTKMAEEIKRKRTIDTTIYPSEEEWQEAAEIEKKWIEENEKLNESAARGPSDEIWVEDEGEKASQSPRYDFDADKFEIPGEADELGAARQEEAGKDNSQDKGKTGAFAVDNFEIPRSADAPLPIDGGNNPFDLSDFAIVPSGPQPIKNDDLALNAISSYVKFLKLMQLEGDPEDYAETMDKIETILKSQRTPQEVTDSDEIIYMTKVTFIDRYVERNITLYLTEVELLSLMKANYYLSLNKERKMDDYQMQFEIPVIYMSGSADTDYDYETFLYTNEADIDNDLNNSIIESEKTRIRSIPERELSNYINLLEEIKTNHPELTNDIEKLKKIVKEKSLPIKKTGAHKYYAFRFAIIRTSIREDMRSYSDAREVSLYFDSLDEFNKVLDLCGDIAYKTSGTDKSYNLVGGLEECIFKNSKGHQFVCSREDLDPKTQLPNQEIIDKNSSFFAEFLKSKSTTTVKESDEPKSQEPKLEPVLTAEEKKQAFEFNKTIDDIGDKSLMFEYQTEGLNRIKNKVVEKIKLNKESNTHKYIMVDLVIESKDSDSIDAVSQEVKRVQLYLDSQEELEQIMKDCEETSTLLFDHTIKCSINKYVFVKTNGEVKMYEPLEYDPETQMPIESAMERDKAFFADFPGNTVDEKIIEEDTGAMAEEEPPVVDTGSGNHTKNKVGYTNDIDVDNYDFATYLKGCAEKKPEVKEQVELLRSYLEKGKERKDCSIFYGIFFTSLFGFDGLLFLTKDEIRNAMQAIRKIDYNIFYKFEIDYICFNNQEGETRYYNYASFKPKITKKDEFFDTIDFEPRDMLRDVDLKLYYSEGILTQNQEAENFIKFLKIKKKAQPETAEIIDELIKLIEEKRIEDEEQHIYIKTDISTDQLLEMNETITISSAKKTIDKKVIIYLKWDDALDEIYGKLNALKKLGTPIYCNRQPELVFVNSRGEKKSFDFNYYIDNEKEIIKNDLEFFSKVPEIKEFCNGREALDLLNEYEQSLIKTETAEPIQAEAAPVKEPIQAEAAPVKEPIQAEAAFIGKPVVADESLMEPFTAVPPLETSQNELTKVRLQLYHDIIKEIMHHNYDFSPVAFNTILRVIYENTKEMESPKIIINGDDYYICVKKDGEKQLSTITYDGFMNYVNKLRDIEDENQYNFENGSCRFKLNLKEIAPEQVDTAKSVIYSSVVNDEIGIENSKLVIGAYIVERLKKQGATMEVHTTSTDSAIETSVRINGERVGEPRSYQFNIAPEFENKPIIITICLPDARKIEMILEPKEGTQATFKR